MNHSLSTEDLLFLNPFSSEETNRYSFAKIQDNDRNINFYFTKDNTYNVYNISSLIDLLVDIRLEFSKMCLTELEWDLFTKKIYELEQGINNIISSDRKLKKIIGTELNKCFYFVSKDNYLNALDMISKHYSSVRTIISFNPNTFIMNKEHIEDITKSQLFFIKIKDIISDCDELFNRSS